MANIKFSQLPNQGLPTDATIIPTVAGGTNFTVTGANLRTYVNSTTGNVTAGNVVTTGQVTAVGNIRGAFILGNGSQLTGISAIGTNYTNANVVALMAAFGSNTISTSGNVSAGNLNVTGNITDSVGVLSLNSASNINLTPTGAVNVAGPVSATGNISGQFLVGNGFFITGITANSTYGNAQVISLLNAFGANTINTTGNITAGNVTTGGNVSGNYILGNGSLLTGLAGNYGNPNVVALMANFGSNTISSTANITGGNINTGGNVTGAFIKGNGGQLAGIVTSISAGSGISVNHSPGAVTITATTNANYGNSNVTSLMASFGSNTVSTSGNITAGFYIGNGSRLSSLAGANVTGAVANATFATTAATATTATTAGSATTAATAGQVTVAAQPAITSVGTLTALSVSGSVIGGNFRTAGSVSATGAVIGSTIQGNGSQLSGIVTSIVAGTGISVSAGTGVVTISASGSAANIVCDNLTVNSNILAYVERTVSGYTTNTSFTPVYSNGIIQNVTANNNFTLAAPTGMVAGQSITLIITQGSPGNRIMTPNAVYKFAYGVKTLSTTPGAIDMMSIFYNGTTYLCNLVKGYV